MMTLAGSVSIMVDIFLTHYNYGIIIGAFYEPPGATP